MTSFCWDYNHSDWGSLRDKLAGIDWSSVYRQDDVEAALKTWLNLFCPEVESFVPKKRLCRNNAKPWYTPFLHKLVCCRNRLFKRSRSLPATYPTQLAYRRVRNLYVKELRFAEREYYCRLTQNLTNKEMSSLPHHWWNQLKSLCGLKKGLDGVSGFVRW